MSKPLPESLYREIYSREPRLTVDAIIKTNAGVVLVKRDIPPCRG
jgi:ADP-ribose pyrophosphatase YjhB (NUDIX family)